VSDIKPRTAEFDKYNTVVNPDQYAIAWRPFYEKGVADTKDFRSAYRNETDVFYGQNPAQILDIYYPKSAEGLAPVYVFLHGGAFREGHPAQYGFVGRPHVERGAIFICAGYRLAPETYYPDTIWDVAGMIGWIYHNIEQRGGDPKRITLSGHSSGSTVSALASVRTDWQPKVNVPTDVLKTMVFCGATYDFRTEFVGNLVTDKERREEATALCNIARVPERALFTFGVNEINRGDGTRFERSARSLAAAMEDKGTDVRIIPLPDADHQGSCASLCDVDGPVLDAVTAVIHGKPWPR